MEVENSLPEELANLAQRRTWFSQSDARRVLHWLNSQEWPLLGIDVARPIADGKWEMLLDPMLTVPDNTGASASIAAGFAFLAAHAEPGLMFEPVWPGY